LQRLLVGGGGGGGDGGGGGGGGGNVSDIESNFVSPYLHLTVV